MHRTLLIGLAGLALAAPAFAVAPAAKQAVPAQQASAPSAPTAAKQVVGHVLLANGKPACGAQVYFTWVWWSGEARSLKLGVDSRGAFDASGKLPSKPNGDRMLVAAVLPGQGLAWRQMAVNGKGLDNLDLKLLPGVILTGRVIRSDGRPAANITMSAGLLIALPPIQSATTDAEDADQRVSFDHLLHPMVGKPIHPFPDEVLTQFHARTDATGRFTLTGLPAGSKVILRTDRELALASGSRNVIDLKADRQDAGLLVAVQPGRVKIHVQDRLTNQSAGGVRVSIFSDSERSASASILLRMMVSTDLVIAETGPDVNAYHFEEAQTNPQGDLEFSRLLPGDYNINVNERIVSTHIEEGQAAAPIQLALRRGALQGRLLDAKGKPLADVPVIALNGAPHNLALGNRAFNPADKSVPKTRADGSFTINWLPWGGPTLTIRAVKGNDLAEWTGAPDELGSTLVLNMRPDALVTVSGRLIDPDRKPLTTERCETIHWLDSPRSTWFATAQRVNIDSNGHFRIVGLERGESFSLVTSGVDLISDFRARLGMPESFESPRFTTPKDGSEQDLGEVMVHPVQGGSEILQYYSEGDFFRQARPDGFLPTPTKAEAVAARQALAQYQKALKANDLDALHQLTSRLSPGWSADRRAFLEHCSLTTLTDADAVASKNLRVLPLVPRNVAEMLLQFNGTAVGLGSNAIDRELDLNPHLAFLAEWTPTGVKPAGLLRKEDGAWRVVSISSESAENGIRNLISAPIQAPEKTYFSSPAPTPAASEQQEALEVATSYLKYWAQNRHDVIQMLTSPQSSLFSTDFAFFQQQFAARRDEGICPLTAADPISLHPLENLTPWDQELLTSPFTREPLNQIVQQGELLHHADLRPPPAPVTFGKRDGAAFFRYSAQGQSFLMALVHCDGNWSVLEPALPM